MNRFYAPADSADQWQALLAKPQLHWKTGYSAKALAHCWTDAGGFPSEIQEALAHSDSPSLREAQFLLGFPEHEVQLPGGTRPSQNDIFVLARCATGLISIAVEGKVSEHFDLPIGERFLNPSSGQVERLEYLKTLLRLSQPLDHIRYQLLHRTASAIIEAQRFGARHALMLVHSFSQTHEHFEDYLAFADLFGQKPNINSIVSAANYDGITLYLGWVVGTQEYLER